MKKRKSQIWLVTVGFLISVCLSLSASAEEAATGLNEKKEVKRPVEMEEMVVTATKTPIDVREVPASVNVVTWEDIKLKARTDNYYDALRSVPGVFVKKEAFQDAIYLRGKLPSIMVNGRDMNTFLTTGSLITSST